MWKRIAERRKSVRLSGQEVAGKECADSALDTRHYTNV